MSLVKKSSDSNQISFSGKSDATTSASANIVRTEVVQTIFKGSTFALGNNLGNATAWIVNYIAYDGTALVMTFNYSSDGSIPCYSTDNGATLNYGTTIGSTGAILVGGPGVIIALRGVAATATGNIKYSTDHGVTWNSPTLPTAAAWKHAATDGQGNWIATNSDTSSTATLVSNDNGVTWSAGGSFANSQTGGYNNICYKDGVWLASAEYGTYKYRSTNNGTSWSSISPPLNTISAAGDYFFSCNENGSNTFYTSVDGISWTQRASINRILYFHYDPISKWYIVMYAGNFYMLYTKDFLKWYYAPTGAGNIGPAAQYGEIVNGVFFSSAFGGGGIFPTIPPVELIQAVRIE